MPDLPPSPIGDGYLVASAFDSFYAMERESAVDALIRALHDDEVLDEEFYQHLLRSPLGRARVWKIYQAGREHERAVHLDGPRLSPRDPNNGVMAARLKRLELD